MTIREWRTGRTGRRTRNSFVLALGAIILAQMSWASVLPLFRGPDEIEHSLRASNVALGSWLPDEQAQTERIVTVDKTLARAVQPVCRELRKDLDPSVCEYTEDPGGSTVQIRANAAEYNFFYYAVVGLPLNWVDAPASMIAMRALSAALCAVALAWAWTITTSSRKSAWPAASFLLALTPAVVFATIVVAPNSWSFTGGLLVWTGMLKTLRTQVFHRSAFLAMTLGAVTLALTHTTGALWLAGIAATAVSYSGLRRLRTIARQAPPQWLWICAIAVLVAVSAAGVWSTAYAPNRVPVDAETFVAETKAVGIPAHAVLWVFQTVGVIPNRFDIMWPIIYGLWLTPLLMVTCLALRHGTKRSRWAIVLVAAMSVAVPTGVTLLTYAEMGVGWQGRYGLPLLFGAVLLAGEALDSTGPRLGQLGWWCLVGTLGVAHVLVVECLGLREAAGPYDDGRPWALILTAVVPPLIAAAYGLLGRTVSMSQSRPSEKADSRSTWENV